jgi:hypothetical protein
MMDETLTVAIFLKAGIEKFNDGSLKPLRVNFIDVSMLDRLPDY